MEVLWSIEKHSIGIDAVDSQHRELFATTNSLYQAREQKLPAERQRQTQGCLKRLLSYSHFHFATEEELMANCAFPGLDAHALLHAGFKERMKALSAEAKDGREPRIDELLDYLVQWIVSHVQEEDQKYAHYFRERGIEPRLHNTPGSSSVEPGKDLLSLWQEKHLALEIHEIDVQHKELVTILQQANDLLRGSPERQRVFLPGIIQKLRYYVEFHFSFEEELMARHGYRKLDEHRKMHDRFVAEVGGFLAAYKAGDEALPGKIVEFLKNWTINHILAEDTKYKNAFLVGGTGG